MSARGYALGAAVALAIAGSWYLAMVKRPRPSRGTDVATASARGLEGASSSQAAGRADGSAAPPLEPPLETLPPVSPEQEQAARELARAPLDEQDPELQQRYYRAVADQLAYSQNHQRSALAQLESERAQLDPALWPALEEAVRMRQQVLARRELRLSHAASMAPPRGP